MTGNLEAVKCLLAQNKGGLINSRGKNNLTPLMFALVRWPHRYSRVPAIKEVLYHV